MASGTTSSKHCSLLQEKVSLYTWARQKLQRGQGTWRYRPIQGHFIVGSIQFAYHSLILSPLRNWHTLYITTVTTPFYGPLSRTTPGKPVPEETLTHPPSWSSFNLYQLLPPTTIHSIVPIQFSCLTIFLHNLSPCPLWSTSWSGALHLILHMFLYTISVFFSQHTKKHSVSTTATWCLQTLCTVPVDLNIHTTVKVTAGDKENAISFT